MTQVRDPVCGMMIDPETAAGRTSHQGTTYFFCSTQCLRQFESDPARYTGAPAGMPVDASRTPSASDASTTGPGENLERHEPPYTKWGGLVAPKFGAAGSGGAEYERLPEAHDTREHDRREADDGSAR